MKHLEKLTRKRLGEILVDEGLISKSQLADAEREQKRTGDPLGVILVEANYMTEFDLAKTVASQYQLPYIQLSLFPRSKSLDGLFPADRMMRQRFLPIDRIGRTLTIAVGEMPDLDFLHDVRERLDAVPFLFVAQLGEIRECIENGAGKPKAAPKSKPAEGNNGRAAGGGPADGGSSEEGPEGMELMTGVLTEEGLDEESGLSENDESEESWQNIFDAANASILREMDEPQSS